MKIATVAASLSLLVSLAACGGGDAAKPAGSSAPAMGGSAAPAAAPTKPSAAASFPAKDLPAPFPTLTLGAPPAAKVETGPVGDEVTIDGPDYMVKIGEAKDADVAKIKEMFTKMGGTLTVEQPDGLIAEMKEKGATSFQIYRIMKIGDKSYKCSNTMKKIIGSADKAQEAFDVCGSLKAK